MTQWNGVSFRDNLAHAAPRQPAKRLISALAVRNARHDVAEAALAHSMGNATETAYFRSDFFKLRRALMNEWSRFLEGGS